MSPFNDASETRRKTLLFWQTEIAPASNQRDYETNNEFASDDTEFERLENGPRAVANSELRQNIGHVILHRSFCHSK